MSENQAIIVLSIVSILVIFFVTKSARSPLKKPQLFFRVRYKHGFQDQNGELTNNGKFGVIVERKLIRSNNIFSFLVSDKTDTYPTVDGQQVMYVDAQTQTTYNISDTSPVTIKDSLLKEELSLFNKTYLLDAINKQGTPLWRILVAALIGASIAGVILYILFQNGTIPITPHGEIIV